VWLLPRIVWQELKPATEEVEPEWLKSKQASPKLAYRFFGWLIDSLNAVFAGFDLKRWR
jgi:hypothetical protein